MDDIPVERSPATEGIRPDAREVRLPDGRVLRQVGPESEVRGGPETADEAVAPVDPGADPTR